MRLVRFRARWLVAAFLSAAPLLELSGCAPSSVLTAPHLPYAPLLQRGGQLDIVARGGVTSIDLTIPTMTSAVQVAYAPIDHLEIAASADADLYDTDEAARTLHAGGGLAIGAFATAHRVRFEALVGADAGWASGNGGRRIPSVGGSIRSFEVPLEASYEDVFAQMLVGLEGRHVLWAIGLRYMMHIGDARAASVGERTQYLLNLLDLFMAVRVPIDRVRIELLFGASSRTSERTSETPPLAGESELGLYLYGTLGLGVQLDTWSSGR